MPDTRHYGAGSTGTGKSHLATALSVVAVRAARSVCRATLGESVSVSLPVLAA